MTFLHEGKPCCLQEKIDIKTEILLLYTLSFEKENQMKHKKISTGDGEPYIQEQNKHQGVLNESNNAITDIQNTRVCLLLSFFTKPFFIGFLFFTFRRVTIATPALICR